MKSISHPQARRWIQARLDQALNETQSSLLDAHLQNCGACRLYAAQIENLDASLRYHFRSQAALLPASLARAADPIYAKSRAKMNTNRIMHFASSLSFGLVLVALAIVLSLAISSLATGTSLRPLWLPFAKPAPTLTPTPHPQWTADSPLTSTIEIITILENLAGENLNLFRSAGWVHTIKSDQGKAGSVPTSYIEGWANYGQLNRTCPEKMLVVQDQPGGESIYQLQVYLEDGSFGDLIQLRKGEGQVETLGGDSSACVLDVSQTSAGALAMKLAGQASSKSGWQVKAAKAWFEEVDGKRAFVVSGIFHSPGSVPPVQIETLAFDFENGLALTENVRMEWEDGSLMGETLSGYSYEILAKLPEDAARQFEQARTELKSYLAGLVTPQAPVTGTPVAGEPGTILQDMPYNQENPLSDGEEILSILAALRQKHIAWMSKPGWYLFGPRQLHPGEWMLDRYVLTHVLDSAGSCDGMTYYVQDGRILPQEVRLADGAWGSISGVEQGLFTEGSSSGEPCRVERVESAQMLDNEIDYFGDFAAGKIGGEYRAWAEDVDGRKAFVLFYDVQYASPKPVTMDPQTGKLEVEDHSLKWNYFDLDSGAWLAGYELAYLGNGKALGASPSGEGEVLQYDSLYYEDLASEILQTFEGTIAKLKYYLENTGQ